LKKEREWASEELDLEIEYLASILYPQTPKVDIPQIYDFEPDPVEM
jgi:hypothetical protein